MADEWHETRLGDLIEIKHGFAFKGKFIHEEPHGDVLLTPGNFALRGGFKTDKFKYYDGPISEEFVLQQGDLIVTMTDLSKQSDTLGYPALLPSCAEGKRYLHNQRLGKISLRESAEISATYIYYVMCSAEYRHEVLASATGTTVKHTSPDRIKQVRFLVPPLAEQRAIAHILGTLDNKIELNLHMNKTLEAMAKALFKSWFVDFDPVRAKAEGRPTGLPAEISDLFPDSFENSELGKIPSGWEVKRLGNLLDVDKGVSYKGDFLSKSNGLPMVNLGCFGGHGSFRNEKMKFYCGKYRDQHLAEAGDLLIANTDMTQNRIILGAVIIIPKWHGHSSFLLSHHVFVARFRENNKLLKRFIYFTLLKAEFRQIAAGHATGTTVLALPKDGIIKYQSVLPSMPLLKVFTDYTESLFSQVDKAIEENNVLSRIRDTLLPKLISGELRIPDAEKILEEVGV